jgi:hypothetical protein
LLKFLSAFICKICDACNEMKIALKVTAGCVWLALIVLFSIYCNGWFCDFFNFIKTKILGNDVSPSIDFAIAFIPWNIFISLLLLLPVFVMRWRQRFEVVREIVAVGIFFILMLGINVFCILIWVTALPDTIGSFSGEPGFALLEKAAINDGWTHFQFRAAWWMYILISTAFGATGPLIVSLIKKEGIVKTLSS